MRIPICKMHCLAILSLIALLPVTAEATITWDLIYIDEMDVKLPQGGSITLGAQGIALLVNTSTETITASDISTLTITTISSSIPGFTFSAFGGTLSSEAPIAPLEAVGSVRTDAQNAGGNINGNDLLLDYIQLSETFRNTTPQQVLALGIHRTSGTVYEGDVTFDIEMEMAGQTATFSILTHMTLGSHQMTNLSAARTPEPVTCLLFALGGLVLLRRRR